MEISLPGRYKPKEPENRARNNLKNKGAAKGSDAVYLLSRRAG
jgi:hypothetical protein